MSRRASALIGVVGFAVLAACVLVAALVSSSDGRAAQRAWSDPGRAPVPTGAVAGATTIVDPAGRVHVAFVERRGGASALLEVVRSPGGVWSAPSRITGGSPFPIVVAGLAADARGDAAVLWSYGAGRRSVLLASTRAATGAWSPEQALSRVRGGMALAQVAVDAGGTTTVVGRGLGGPGLWAVRRTTAGDWSAPERISPPGAGTDAPTLVVSADGRAEVIALLKAAGRPRVLWAREADASGRWGAEARLPGSGLATNATLATSAGGSLVASWVRRAATGAQRMAATRSAAGAWSGPVPIDDPSTDQWGLSAAVAGPAGPSVIWTRWDGRPQDRRVSLRSAEIASPAGAAPRTLQSLRLAPVPVSPGGAVIFGTPPVDLRAAAGREPTLIWNATSASRPGEPAAVSVSTRSGGSWSVPHTLSTPGRLGYPVALGAGPESPVAVWAEAPPLGPANALFVSERR